MELFSLKDLIGIVVLIFLLQAYLFFRLKDQKKIATFSLLFFYHCIFIYFFTVKSMNGLTDSYYYYTVASNPAYEPQLDVMRHFVFLITYVPANLMEMGYAFSSFFFGTLGFLGLLLFFEKAYDLFEKKLLLILLMFLPSIHYWTSNISKEVLVVLGSGIVISEIYKRKWSFTKLILGFVIVFLTRPYMAMLLGLSLIVLQIWADKILTPMKRFFLLIASFVGFAIATHFMLNLLNITSAESMGADILNRQQNWSAGGSTIDLSQYNFLQRIFIFLYRPLFYDATNIPMLASSSENIIILFASLALIYTYFKSRIIKLRDLHPAVKLGMLYFIFSVILLSTVTGNLGTAVRKKATILPPFIVLVSYAYYARKNKLKVQNQG